MTPLSDNNYSHILIRLSSIELCYNPQIHVNDHTKSATGKLCALLECLLSVPVPMAGSVMYHLEAQRRLLQRCFACSMLVKSEHKHCGKLSLVNMKNHNKSYWITNIIAVIVLKPKLLNALKFWLILKKYLSSLIWTPFLMKSYSHQNLNILMKGNSIHIFHFFFFIVGNKCMFCTASWEWKK